MLYLNPPFWVIEGVSLFPDHEDPLQFYFMPMMPHLTADKDAATGASVPRIQLIKYRGRAGNGGFLNFDVNVGLDPAVQGTIEGTLRNQAHLSDTPRLAPLPLVDGTVKLLLLGAETAPPPDPHPTTRAAPVTDDKGLRFVTKISQNAKPALYGDNQATFSVALDQYGVTILEQALRGELSPIGIVYSLDFLALRPAYRVHLTVDWNRVQTHLDDSFSGGFLFVSTEVDKAVDKLIEDKVIDLQVDTFVEDSEANKDVITSKQQAVAEVRDMIKSTFFESSILPPKPGEPDGWDKAAKFANSISELAVTGGMSSLGGFSYKHVDLTRIDKKNLNMTVRERDTVRRTIYPQGHLKGLFSALRQPGMTLDRFMLSVDIDDPWFDRRKVQVLPRADFDADQLTSIDVDMEYNKQPQNVILDKNATTASKDWPSKIDNNVMAREVTYSYKVTFNSDADRSQRPVRLETGQLVTTEDALEVVPRDLLYAVSPVPILALGVPWNRYDAVQVRCKYTDAANQIALDRTFMLDSSNTSKTWPMFLRDITKKEFQYQLTYFAKRTDGDPSAPADVTLDWVTTDQERITVRDPFPPNLRLQIIPQLDWTQYDNAYVDAAYLPAGGAEIDGSFSFSKTDAAPKSFSVHALDPTDRLFSYEVSLTQKGKVTNVPRSLTREPRLIVRANMPGHRIALVHPARVDFAPNHLVQIQVDVKYADTDAGLSFSDSFTFKAKTDQAWFDFDYASQAKNKLQFRYSATYDNGLSRQIEWADSGWDEIVIPVT